MSISHPLRSVVVALAAATSLAGAGMAWSAPLPPVHQHGAISYVSGGVGKDSAATFQAAAKEWPAILEFVVKSQGHDDYLANVRVDVRDAQGHAVLRTVSDGPFLLVRMPAGTYQVKASFGGKTLDRALHVQEGQHVREIFVWPASELKKGA